MLKNKKQNNRDFGVEPLLATPENPVTSYSHSYVLRKFRVDERLETVCEDESIRMEEDCREHFGQNDHLRVFGADSTALLESFGFTVEEIRGDDYDSSIKPITGPADYDYNVIWKIRV